MTPFHSKQGRRRITAGRLLSTLFLAAVIAGGASSARADGSDAGQPPSAGSAVAPPASVGDGGLAAATTDGGVAVASTDGGAAAGPEALHFLAPGEGRKKPGVVVFTQDLDINDVDSVQPTKNFPFFARVDRVILTGQVRLLFVPPPDHSRDIRSIDVLVNQEKIGTLDWPDLMRHREPRTLTIPPQLMGDRNLLTLRMLVDDEGPCGEVPEGVWRALKEVRVITEAAPLHMPNNLGLLPVPFVDRDFDKTEATIPFVLAPDANSARLENAGIVASWFGTMASPDLDFPVRLGELPDSSAVVLVDSAQAAQSLGLPAPDGPLVQMLDHPRFPGTNYKILLIAGRTPEELKIAVHSLVAPNVALAGEVVHFTTMPHEAPALPYDAPRWLPFQKVVPFEQFPITPYSGPTSLTLEGGRDGTIPLRFRVAPDLWSWPTEFVDLDLGYSIQLAPGVQVPRLDLDFNGTYLGTLPSLDPAHGDRDGRVKLRVRAQQIRGFNEFDLHVHYPRQEGECDNGPTNESRVTIAPDSTLHIEGFGHFANMPDVGIFVHDGFPFSRIADLGETAVIVPPNTQAPEVGTFLSMMSHMGTVTGRVGTRVTVLDSSEFDKNGAPGKDLLVIGRFDNHPLIQRWSDRMPLVINAQGGQVELPVESSSIRRLWHSALSYIDLDRARQVLYRERQFSAVVGIPSPVEKGRSVVVVTATSGALMPSSKDFAGSLTSRFSYGDLLISAGVQRWMFEIAPVYGQGVLSDWVAVRRFFAMEFPLLLPGMVLGSVLLAFQLRSGMSRRIKKRLGQEES